ncbi:MAG: hypothetical protein AB7V42_11535 [Thermoleophilia bacterium]
MRTTGTVTKLALVALVVALTAGTGTAAAATDAETRLAQRYAPIAELRVQKAECDRSGEAYPPIPVDAVLSNPEISLRGPGAGGPVVKQGPSARDLYGVSKEYYLDFPGDPRRPGCGYERDGRRFDAGMPNVAYAHIARQADRPDRIALQYWLYYYFNDFNNTHESDWEFVQIVFPASSAEEALRVSPVEVGYAQHSGGERAGWDDDKLERRGDRPVVYVAAGSHASFFSPHLYLGRSANEGFGCDDTRTPSRAVPLEARLLPDEPSGPDDPAAWLGFAGHWGELRPPPFDGPTGPAAKRQWTRPIDWQDDLRDGSVVVPSGLVIGPAVSGFFCGAVESGSHLLLDFSISPLPYLGLLLVLLAALGTVVTRTDWALVPLPPLAARRTGGEAMRSSTRFYRSHIGAVMAMGIIFIPLGIVAAGVHRGLLAIDQIGALSAISGGVIAALLGLFVGGAGNLAGTILVDAASAWTVEDAGAGRRVAASSSWAAVGARFWALVRTVLRAAIPVVLLLASVIGIPWAIRRLVRVVLVPQVVMIEGRSGADAIRRSAALVRGRGVEVAGRVLGVSTIGLAAGPIVAVPLLFLTGLPLPTVNAIGSLVYVLTMPWVGITMTLLYGDLVAREDDGDAPGEGDRAAG